MGSFTEWCVPSVKVPIAPFSRLKGSTAPIPGVIKDTLRLAPRLALAFGALTVFGTAGLGVALRHDRRVAETARYYQEVEAACSSVSDELARQAERDQKLINGACKNGELVDELLLRTAGGETSTLGFRLRVPDKRTAYELDELILVGPGDAIVGADPHALLSTSSKELDAQLAPSASGYALRTKGVVGISSQCSRRNERGRAGLIGVRYLDPMLARMGKPLGVVVGRDTVPASPRQGPGAGQDQDDAQFARARCVFRDVRGAQVPLVVTKSKAALQASLEQIDRTVTLAAAVALGVSLVLGLLLARSLSRPLATLAKEAPKVAADQAKPLALRGSGEVRELVLAFNRMIEDLSVARRRLAATNRIAAWREVARRVAHEVKNPLAPIRAAVETLRRLRARQDPAFDEYFDEATRTVLDEVHRISGIVTEFTRFARLPTPRPQEFDLEDAIKHVLALHRGPNGESRIDFRTKGAVPKVRADRDQMIQVITNLVQNAVEASRNEPDPRVEVVLEADGADRVLVSVMDNGPGVPPEFASRLFEPYATTKASGTGLGLAISQRIAMEHNGELAHLPDARAHGAVFRLTLSVQGPPVTDADAPPSGG